MNKLASNSQIDRIFNEIKEIGIRDSNNNDVQDSENIYSFQPGFVSLLKNRFSNFDKDIALPNFDRFKPVCNLRNIPYNEVSAIEINEEEIPLKNIVSDTRRVFECIAPKGFENEDISNDKGYHFSKNPSKVNTLTNSLNCTKNKVSDINQIFNTKEDYIENFGSDHILNKVDNSLSDISQILKSNDIPSEDKSNIKLLTNDTNHEPSNVSEKNQVSKLREIYKEDVSNVSNYNYNNYSAITKPKLNGVNNLKKEIVEIDQIFQSKEAIKEDFGNDQEITNIILNASSNDSRKTSVSTEVASQVFKHKKLYNKTILNENGMYVSNDIINPKDVTTNISILKFENPETNNITITKERYGEKSCNGKEISSMNSLNKSNDITDKVNMTKNKDMDIKQTSKRPITQSESNNFISYPIRQKPARPVSNEIKSFIFNACDFKNRKDNELIDDFNYQEFEEIKSDPSLKSILNDKCVVKHVNFVRNLRFANNDLLITIHNYEPEYSSIEEYNTSNLINNEISNNSAYQTPNYKTGNLKTDSFNKDSSIVCDVDDNVMDFKSDMLF